MQDFWRRWHISLSTWLRDYLYIPLGGNRRGELAIGRNLLITMVLGGIWHGAAWNFAVWGLLHAVFLALHRAAARLRPGGWTGRRAPLGDVFSVVVTFHLVALTWLSFRAEPVAGSGALAVAVDYGLGLGALVSDAFAPPPLAFWLLAPVLALDLLTERAGGSWWSQRWHWASRGVVTAGLALAGFVLGGGASRAFIYFQF